MSRFPYHLMKNYYNTLLFKKCFVYNIFKECIFFYSDQFIINDVNIDDSDA